MNTATGAKLIQVQRSKTDFLNARLAPNYIDSLTSLLVLDE